MHFGVNSRQVMSETIDGETIIIHLGTGSYYSLQKAGVDVWDALARGADEAQVLDELAQRYKAPNAQLEASIADLIRELQAENLLVESAEESTYRPREDHPAEPQAFEEPHLEKHTDMQDIILLDPVHEVDDRGWPHASEAAVG